MKTEINYKRIGAHLKNARKNRNETQRKVADYLSIQETSYSNLECGHENISLRRVIELCEHFDILPGDVLNDCTACLFERSRKREEACDRETQETPVLSQLMEKCYSLSDRDVYTLLLMAEAMQKGAEKE